MIEMPLGLADGRLTDANEVWNGRTTDPRCLVCGGPLRIGKPGADGQRLFLHTGDACSANWEDLLRTAGAYALAEAAGRRVTLHTVSQTATLHGVHKRDDGTLVCAVDFEPRGRSGQPAPTDLAVRAKVVLDLRAEVKPAPEQVERAIREQTPLFQKVASLEDLFEPAPAARKTLHDNLKFLLLSANAGNWLSLAGLPDAVLECGVSRVHLAHFGPLLDLAAHAYADAKIAVAKKLLQTVQHSTDQFRTFPDLPADIRERWAKGVALVARTDPDGHTCPRCCREKKLQYDTCYVCHAKRTAGMADTGNDNQMRSGG